MRSGQRRGFHKASAIDSLEVTREFQALAYVEADQNVLYPGRYQAAFALSATIGAKQSRSTQIRGNHHHRSSAMPRSRTYRAILASFLFCARLDLSVPPEVRFCYHGNTMDRAWKAFERRLARRVGGRRIPVTGERDGADVVAGPFVYQAKLRRGLPSYLKDWLRGIVAAGERSDGSTGVVVWKAPNARDDDAVVVLRLKDWQDWHGRVGY